MAKDVILIEGNIGDEVYGFLSKTIYDQLIDHGIDKEYIFTLALYLHICIIKEFFDSEGIYKPTIFETLSDKYNIPFNGLHNNVAIALYSENCTAFRSIYDEVSNSNASPELSWLMDWKNLCNSAFSNQKVKEIIVVFLMNAVNECLDIPEEGVTAPAIVIKLIQMIYQENKLASEVNEYIKRNSYAKFRDSFNKQPKVDVSRPVIASTKTEISRLQAAWESPGIEHEVVAARIANADQAIASGLVFPLEGGQHEQWYQCDSCEVPLSIIDAHHHQCSSCNRIYSGFPYDNVIYDKIHRRNIKSGEDAAWAWAITGEIKYANFAAEILAGYADRYLDYPMLHTKVNDKRVDVTAEKQRKYKSAGRLHSQTLTEANSLLLAAITYDLIYNTLSERQKRHIEKNFFSAMVENINLYKGRKSNWQTWHNAALLYTGAVMGDVKIVREALLDEENGFSAQMRTNVTPEGMWHENSWGYHYYALSAMTYIAEGCRRLGIDLYNFASLRRMYSVAFGYLMGDGSLPRFGNSVEDSPLGHTVNEIAYASYKNDCFLAAVPLEPNWDSIALGRKTQKKEMWSNPESKLMPGAGHAILATDGLGKITVAFTFGLRGIRSHLDKLSFVMYGYGQELGVDPGRSTSQAYRLRMHREWYEATVAHNTVLVDGSSQREADGQCLAFCFTDTHAAVTATLMEANDNVLHTRFMFLSTHYLLVIDELRPSDENTHIYEWMYHNKGKEIKTSLLKSDFILGKNPSGYAYLKDIISYKPKKGQPIEIEFAGNEIGVYMTMVGEEKDEVFTATGPHTNLEDRAPMVVVRRKGQTVRFATVLEPVPSVGKQTIKSLNLVLDSSLKAIVGHEEGEDCILFPEGNLKYFIAEKVTNSGSKTVLRNEKLQ